jgi:hypothetical protein
LAGIALAPAATPETNSKPLDVSFFGSNLFLSDGRFNKPPERPFLYLPKLPTLPRHVTAALQGQTQAAWSRKTPAEAKAQTRVVYIG